MSVFTDSRTARGAEAPDASGLDGAGSAKTSGVADPDWDAAVTGLRAALRLAGMDPEDPRVAGTPERVIRALVTACDRAGLESPEILLTKRFDTAAEGRAVPVVVGPVPFSSLCEHHLLPFRGSAWLGYIPQSETGGYVGLSKLARLVAWHTRAMGMQERITQNLLSDLRAHLEPAAAAVMIKADHTCMSCRGAEAEGALTTTWLTHGDAGTDLLARMQ
jgi:GTP cyclohydrolase IA